MNQFKPWTDEYKSGIEQVVEVPQPRNLMRFNDAKTLLMKLMLERKTDNDTDFPREYLVRCYGNEDMIQVSRIITDNTRIIPLTKDGTEVQ